MKKNKSLFYITAIKGKPILNSAGFWTLEVELTLNNKFSARASVPEGISTGQNEVNPLPINQALQILRSPFKNQLQKQPFNQKSLDQFLEAKKLGSNLALAISVAFARASGFLTVKKPKLPKLLLLVFEGKKHGNPKLKIQEFMVICQTFKEAFKLYHACHQLLQQEGIITTVGEEGGFSPPNLSEEDILLLMSRAGARNIALDVAANTNPPSVSFLLDIVRRFPVFLLEDPLSERRSAEEWRSFRQKVKKIDPQTQIIGDDLTVTDPIKIKKATENQLIDGVIIKPNQQGTLTKALKAVKVAKKLGLTVIVSHRGQETNDSWIVDFALKAKADYVKFGGLSRGERIAKYNQLLSFYRKL